MAEEFVNEQNVTEVIEKNEASYEEVKVSSEETDTDDFSDWDTEDTTFDDADEDGIQELESSELDEDYGLITDDFSDWDTEVTTFDDFLDLSANAWNISHVFGYVNEIRTNMECIRGILLHNLELQNNEKMMQFVDAFGRELSNSIKGIKNAIAVNDTTNTAINEVNKERSWEL